MRKINRIKIYKIKLILGNIRSLIKTPNSKIQLTPKNIVIYLSTNEAQDTKLTLDTDESYHLQVLTKDKNELEVMHIF